MKNTMRLFLCVLFSAGLMAGMAVAQEEAGLQDESGSQAGLLTVGAQFGEDNFEGYGDILVPFIDDPSGVWLLNLRGSGNDNRAEEMNVGVVYRKLLPDVNMIIGANAYYDSRWTQHNNQFNQFGLGFEVLTRDIDFRMNAYLPENSEKLADSVGQSEMSVSTFNEYRDPYARRNQIRQDYTQVRRETTTTKFYDKYEQGRRGMDVEVGYRIPVPENYGEVRVFGGYYNWEAQYVGEENLSGFKGRVEARVLPILYLDAGFYEDKEVNGGDWYAGARLNVPFDAAAAVDGKNPFEGDVSPVPSSMQDRLYEMVVRDLRIQMEETDYEEAPDKETVSFNDSRTKKSQVLMDNVTFVDDDNTGVENGTAERPYNTIQEGVDNASSPVYVYEGGYNEAVVMRDNVSIYGSGKKIRGGGGRSFGSGIHAEINGDQNGPAFTLANNVTLSGFRIFQVDTDGIIGAGVALDATPTAAMGIYGENVTGVRVSHNIIDGASRGIDIQAAGIPNFNGSLHRNTIRNSTLAGANVDVTTMRDIQFSATENRFFRNAVGGLSGLFTSIGGGVDVEVSGNLAQNNPGFGLFITGVAPGAAGDVHMLFENNTVAGQSGIGLFATLVAGRNVGLTLKGNDIHAVPGFGLFATLSGVQGEGLFAEHNTFANTLAGGAVVFSTLPGAVLDFGGGLLGSDGQNSFYGNPVDILNLSPATLSAQHNYWGGIAPVLVGPVDANLQLAEDPNL